MSSELTFAELFSRIPREKRTDGSAVLVALQLLQRSPKSGLSTREIAAFLRLHMRSKAPRNTSDALSKLVPLVERIQDGTESLTWGLTQSGLRKIHELVRLPPEGASRSFRIDAEQFHPRIWAAAKDLLGDRHFAAAVGRAAKELNRLVRDRTVRPRDDGVPMMHQVFSEAENGQRRLLVRQIREDWERDLQVGLRFMMAGCQAGIANVDKHGDLFFDSKVEALECIAFISHLARQVERAVLQEPRESVVTSALLSKAA
jgi:uncharacterized protein (TIGR02391 family)